MNTPGYRYKATKRNGDEDMIRSAQLFLEQPFSLQNSERINFYKFSPDVKATFYEEQFQNPITTSLSRFLQTL